MVLLWQSSAFLLRLGFFPQHAGFGYLACAISSIAANPMNYYGHGSDIFGILESEYGISRAKATRCMRYSIAIAWQSQENKEFHALFKSYGDEFPPPVSEFIFRSAFEIRSAQIRESETDNSISSVFMIMDAGLRGYQVGGAQVSEKHCGFVINKGDATAADICQLMRDVSDKVQAQFGVVLEPEVKMIGEF